MQSAFFKLANVIPVEDAINYMKDAAKKSYAKKGEDVVKANYAAIDAGVENLEEIKYPASWADATEGAVPVSVTDDEYFHGFIKPILAQKGDTIPVSLMSKDGTVPTGTTKFEKRGIAVQIPEWNHETCIQCNQCSFVCPHAAIRPVLLTEEEAKSMPETFVTVEAKGKEFAGMRYRMQVSPLDCTGCGNCANVCPSKPKSLTLVQHNPPTVQEDNWNAAIALPEKHIETNYNTVKGSQFKKPLFEFSAHAQAAAKLVHQAGYTAVRRQNDRCQRDRLFVNLWRKRPTCPYTVNEKGHGPAWANSLFEDNAEFGYGMNLAITQRRAKLAELVRELAEHIDGEGKQICENWLNSMDDAEGSKKASEALKAMVQGYMNCGCDCDELCAKIYEMSDLMVKKSIWIFGGDGWAYDIGYGGLDHVLAMNEDVNILVLDTEVYSNTGGQSSKATPTGAIAKFAAAGKRTKKKDLGLMAMSYGYVYVAKVAMGANQNQLMKAITEAEAYKGPSLIIAYAPCINHTISAGMGRAQEESKKAVEAGYWQLYRYNPMLADEGKNPFILDSKAPTVPYREFLMGEMRYASLTKQFPEKAEELFKRAEEEALEKYEYYKKLSEIK